MNFYKLIVSPPIAGSDTTFLFRLAPFVDPEEIAREKAIEYIEGYCDPIKEEEENGCEFEYDYAVVEIDEEEYQDLLDDGYEDITP